MQKSIGINFVDNNDLPYIERQHQWMISFYWFRWFLSVLNHLFAEELGIVIEVLDSDVDAIMGVYNAANVPCTMIGVCTRTDRTPLVRGGIMPSC